MTSTLSADGHRQAALVVVVDRAVATALSAALEQCAVDPVEAASIDSAMRLLQSGDFSLVLADDTHVRADQFGFVRWIRRNAVTRDLPVILIANGVEEREIEAFLRAGVSSYIDSSFDAFEVCIRVQTQLRLLESLRRLQQREQELAVINQAARDAIVTIDNTGNISQWNRAAEIMFKYRYEDVIGRNAHDLLAPKQFHEAYRRAFPIFQATGRGEAIGKSLELVAVKKNGEAFPIEISLAATTVDSKWCAVAIIRDITERKAAEKKLEEERAGRERAEIELRHAQKLEAVGQLAAGIAHEINTPIQFVGDSVHFLKEAYQQQCTLIERYRDALERLGRLGKTPDYERIVDASRQAEIDADLEYLTHNAPAVFDRCFDGIERITSIVGAMKEFAHPDQNEKSPADLNQALKNTITISRNEYKYVAEVEMEFGEIPAVACHLGALNQVFLNLLVNAAHAIADVVCDRDTKGTIRVRSIADGDWVRIEFEDSGTGIPEAIRNRIFDPFFTTKEIGKGSGQGLAIARSIVVDKHGGSLTFNTEVGKGTTFIVRLPVEGKKML
jgi:two-component system, NtrC family, sensor kinase